MSPTPPPPDPAGSKPAPLRKFDAQEFSSPSKECDLVMKGGVTSGVVYPYAILELARKYRFRSIGGTSAGAIAAAFAAAAEYSRAVRGDPAGYVRLQLRCDQLPGLLKGLFQPAPSFAPLMSYLLAVQASKLKLAWLWFLPVYFWFAGLFGALAGMGLLLVLQAGPAGVVLGGTVGAAAAVTCHLLLLIIRGLPKHGFGLCPGLTQPGHMGPSLTDWLHSSIQDIAFGDAAHPGALTFGDLAGGDPTTPGIELKMVTTNLSMRRPHTLPRIGLPAGFRLDEWSKLFPSPVIEFLQSCCPPLRRLSGVLKFPAPDRLPVIVAVRMSLSFPFLIAAVPMIVRDVESAMLARKTGGDGRVHARKIWFTDGGISSNFPIHLFDALLPTRPTFALSLDDMPPGGNPSGPRVFIPISARDGIGLPVHPVNTIGEFAFGLLGAAKDWQDQLLACMPGQRERIAKVMLTSDEGGLNLTMSAPKANALMTYGRDVGAQFAGGALNFEEHKWRRALVGYEQVERLAMSAHTTWNGAGFSAWLRTYMSNPQSYLGVTKTDRRTIHHRLSAFADLGMSFEPPVARKDRKFPRPSGRLRIGPDV